MCLPLFLFDSAWHGLAARAVDPVTGLWSTADKDGIMNFIRVTGKYMRAFLLA